MHSPGVAAFSERMIIGKFQTCICLLALALAGCGRPADDRVQGYVEGEFVYVASPLAGALETLSVQRGTNVLAGAPLFELEHAAETAAKEQAERRLEAGRAQLADAQKGQRSSEIKALEAQLEQARSALVFSENEWGRQSQLASKDVSSPQDLDKAKAARDRDQHRVAQLEAELQTARLGSRTDQIAAAEANVRALEAALARAEWDLGQKRQCAPVAGFIFDTLYRQGEWIPSGRPVISLLPPAGIKVRAFVPEPRIGNLHIGDTARVFVDGAGELPGKIRFISPQAEYTPPVIYSRESRDKLVFMIEIAFEPDVAVRLHPGQPVDVRF